MFGRACILATRCRGACINYYYYYYYCYCCCCYYYYYYYFLALKIPKP